jgi:hypothetical protein
LEIDIPVYSAFLIIPYPGWKKQMALIFNLKEGREIVTYGR